MGRRRARKSKRHSAGQSDKQFEQGREKLLNNLHARQIHKRGGVTIGDAVPELANLKRQLARS